MVSACVLACAAAAMIAAEPNRRPMVRFGGEPSRGLLRNRSTGSRPFDLPDPRRPTVVFIHGFNPAPWLVHFDMAERLGEALSRRHPGRFNVLSWDWNAATFDSPSPRVNSENAVSQGRSLAIALIRSGLDPASIHLIGHSAGGMVATSAAHHLAHAHRRPVAQLTLLEPATFYHELIFRRLEAGSVAPVVENYWSPGPSAYGKEVPLPGVTNIRILGTASYRGIVLPHRSDHLSIVGWYIDSIDARRPGFGFGTNPFGR